MAPHCESWRNFNKWQNKLYSSHLNKYSLSIQIRLKDTVAVTDYATWVFWSQLFFDQRQVLEVRIFTQQFLIRQLL